MSERFEIGQKVPLPKRRLDVRPAFTGPGKTSFRPARREKKGPGK